MGKKRKDEIYRNVKKAERVDQSIKRSRELVGWPLFNSLEEYVEVGSARKSLSRLRLHLVRQVPKAIRIS
jgi:hypothetical protein